MDFNKLIARLKAILLSPKTEWPVIAAEPATTSGLFTHWILLLAAIGPVAAFIGLGVFGMKVPLVGTVHLGIGMLLTQLVLGYALAVAMAFLMAVIVNALAPGFGGQSDQLQALKTIAYANSAGWLAAIVSILPLGVLGSLVSWAGVFYGVYLIFLGLPHTMKCPPDKAAGYTAVTCVIGVVLSFGVGIVLSLVTAGAMLGAGASTVAGLGGSGNGKVDVEPGSPLAKIAAAGEQMAAAGARMEEAQKKLDAAQKSGNPQQQAEAAKQMLAAAMGGDASVEALDPQTIGGFVPQEFAGLKRSSYSAERNGAIGLQVAVAQGRYKNEDGGQSYEVEITDTGGAKGFMAMAGWAMIEQDKATDSGYEKVYHQGGHTIHEEWNKDNKSAEYTVILADRFLVKVRGDGVSSMDDLKSAAAKLDLGGLEALKDKGVKKG